MNREVITNRQGVCIVALFTIGSSIVIGAGGGINQDVWIAILMGFIMSIPMIYIYSKLLTAFAGKNLYDIMICAFGNIFGKIVILLFSWYSFHLGALVIRNITEFANVISLPETPQLAIALFLSVLCIWGVRAGIDVLAQWSIFVFPIISITFIGMYIVATTKMHFINLKPVLYNGIMPVIPVAFGYFSFPFAESVIFTAVFHTLKQKNKIRKVLLAGVFIGFLYILISTMKNILILGVKYTSMIYFPSYTADRVINIGESLQRIEILVATEFMLSGFVKISVCLYAASNGIAKLFNMKSYKQIVAPVGFLMMLLSILIYDNTMEMFEWTAFYKYYAIPFQIIIPIALLIAAKIKSRNKK